MTAEQIREIIENGEYEVYGIRVDYEKLYEAGDYCYVSHQWWQDDPGEDSGCEYNAEEGAWDGGELNGTCALEVTEGNVDDVLEQSSMYVGDNIVLIAGDSYEAGNDMGEVVIEDAKVLAVIQ